MYPLERALSYMTTERCEYTVIGPEARKVRIVLRHLRRWEYDTGASRCTLPSLQ